MGRGLYSSFLIIKIKKGQGDNQPAPELRFLLCWFYPLYPPRNRRPTSGFCSKLSPSSAMAVSPETST